MGTRNVLQRESVAGVGVVATLTERTAAEEGKGSGSSCREDSTVYGTTRGPPSVDDRRDEDAEEANGRARGGGKACGSYPCNRSVSTSVISDEDGAPGLAGRRCVAWESMSLSERGRPAKEG